MPQLTQPEIVDIQTYLNTLPSKRARLREGLIKLLNTITKSRGYQTDIFLATYNLKGWDQTPADQTPVLYLVNGNTRITRHASLTREYEYRPTLFGVCKDMEVPAMEEFITDVEQCIYDNNTLFGQLNKMEVDDIQTDNGLFDNIGLHLFEVTLLLQYTRSARDAR